MTQTTSPCLTCFRNQKCPFFYNVKGQRLCQTRIYYTQGTTQTKVGYTQDSVEWKAK